MWPMTLEVAMIIIHDRQMELLKTAQAERLANALPARPAAWQRFLGRVLVGIGGALTTWGANLRHEAEYHEASPLPTTSLAR